MIDETMKAVHVDKLPDDRDMDQGKLYIDDHHQLAAHLCCCGCGERILLDIGPAGWRYTEIDCKPTLDPMIGNLGLPCKSRYSIRNGEVIWV